MIEAKHGTYGQRWVLPQPFHADVSSPAPATSTGIFPRATIALELVEGLGRSMGRKFLNLL